MISSIELNKFSSELSFFLADFKTKIWYLYVFDPIIVKLQGELPSPFNFFIEGHFHSILTLWFELTLIVGSEDVFHSLVDSVNTFF